MNRFQDAAGAKPKQTRRQSKSMPTFCKGALIAVSSDLKPLVGAK